MLAFAALGFLATAGVLTAQAASPVFNGLAGDPATLQVAKAGGAYGSSANVAVGDVVNLFVSIHNSVVDTTMHNETVKIALPAALESSHTVTATLSASNATSVTGTATVNVGTPSNLTYIPGSARFYRASVDANGNSTYVQVNFPSGVNGDDVVGNGVNLGDQQGCVQFMQGVLIQARVTAPVVQGAPIISTNKKVSTGASGNYATAVTASPGDTAWFEVYVQNTGTADGTGTKIVDTLDPHFSYIPGSSIEYVKQNNADAQININDSLIKIENLPGGQRLTWAFGTLRPVPQDAFYLVFAVKIADKSAFTAGTTVTLHNTATSSFDQTSAQTNAVDVTITVPTNPVVSFTLRKEVMNITTGENKWYDTQLATAAPGQTVAYRLIVLNTGNTDAANVTLKDLLPSGVTFAGSTMLYTAAKPAGTAISGNDIVGNGLNIGTVPAGNTNASTLIFNATLPTQCTGTQTLVNTGQVFYNNQKQAEDTATVSFGCTPGLTIRKDMKGPKDTAYVNTSTNILNAGDTVYYRINVGNSGNTTIVNPTLRDVLPKFLTYAGSLSIDGEFQADATAQHFLTDGIILTNLPPGLSKEIIVKTTVVACPDAVLGNNPVVNTAFVKADGIAEISASATGNLVVQVAKLPTN